MFRILCILEMIYNNNPTVNMRNSWIISCINNSLLTIILVWGSHTSQGSTHKFCCFEVLPTLLIKKIIPQNNSFRYNSPEQPYGK